MKKYIYTALFLISMTGCANQSLERLKQIEIETREGVVTSYEDALDRQHLERRDVECQIIDVQSEYAFTVNAYIKKTGITPKDLDKDNVFSLEEIEKHEEIFYKKKEKRLNEIEESYNNFKKTIKEKSINDLNEEIKKLEDERSKTGKGLWSGIRNLWGLLDF